ncbi:MAG: TolC family protein [Vicingaceae bacterium]|nr:TolC family protein [Vicingaceae bacterium]
MINEKQKRSSKVGWLTLLIMILMSIESFAQQGNYTNLTLKDVLQVALNTNHEIKKAKLEVESGHFKTKEVWAGALPTVEGVGGLTHNPLLQQSALPGEIFGEPGTTMLVALGQKWNTNIGVTVSQVLFNQSVFAGLKAAKTSQELYELQTSLTEEAIIEQVTSAYYAILIQQKKLSVVDTTISNTQQTLDIAITQYDNGLIKEIDKKRLMVTVSNLKSQRQQLQNELDILTNQLKLIAGIPMSESLSLAAEESFEEKGTFSENINISNRTEMAMLETQQRLLQIELQATKGGRYPTLSLSGNYSYQGLSNEFPYGAGDQANWFDVASIGLNLKIPIFNGFATNAKIQQSKIANQIIQEDIALTTNQLNFAVTNAKNQIENNLITLNIQKENVELAREVASSIKVNYNNGLASLNDLLSSETSLTESENNYLMAMLNYKIAEIELIKAAGNLKSLIK